MKKSVPVFLLFIFFVFKGYCQTPELISLVEEGVKLHDNGDYKGAIEQYKKALTIDKASALVHYEMASSYFALKEYGKAIEHANNIISARGKYIDQAYILKGSAQDLSGKPKEAIKTYKEAIKTYPDNNLLYYNLALTSYNLKEYKSTEEALQKALLLKPSHASSHLMLGYLMSDQGYRVKSLLALYNFLLLEPKGNRTKSAYTLLDDQLKKGVTKDNDKSTTITLSGAKESDEFRAAELMLSLLEASKGIEKNEGKTEQELFSKNTGSFFAVLGELKKESKGFWWNYYVDFFYTLKTKDHIDAYTYFISQSKDDEQVNAWLKDNKDKIEEFLKWYSTYERKL